MPTIPSYRRHKPSGQAIVSLDGRDFYLGPWRSRASRNEYDRVIGEWLAGGRQLSDPKCAGGITVTEVIAHYHRFAEEYYRKGGETTNEVCSIRAAVRPLKRLYGRCAATDFGPLALKAVRRALIKGGACRGYANASIDRIRRMFKWAVANELVPPRSREAIDGSGRGAGRRALLDPERECSGARSAWTVTSQSSGR